MKDSQIGKCARIAVAVFCLGEMLVVSSAQQPKTGQIRGHVVDLVGATIARAQVFVHRNTPPEDKVSLATHTDIHGDFVLVLPKGGYDVLVTSPGFVAGIETVPVLAGKTKKLQWTLKVLPCDFPGMNCDTVF